MGQQVAQVNQVGPPLHEELVYLFDFNPHPADLSAVLLHVMGSLPLQRDATLLSVFREQVTSAVTVAASTSV